MDAMGFDTSSEEEHVWTSAAEADQQQARDWAERCALVVRGYALAAAAGRAEFVVCEIAASFLVSEHAARDLLVEARLLVSLPALRDAVEDGRLRLPHVRAVIAELLPVDEALHAGIVDDVLRRVSDQPPARVRQIVKRAVLRADPAAARRRKEVARKLRGLSLLPLADGMADLVLTVEAEVAVRLYGLADAATRRDDGSGRTADARRVDWVAEQVLARGAEGASGSPDGRSPSTCQALVTIPVTTALGLDDEPCELAGYGPISAEHGRELLASAELRKACVDAVTGEVLAVDPGVVRRSKAGGGSAAGASLPSAGPSPTLRRALLDLVASPSSVPVEPEPRYRPSTGLARTVRARSPRCEFPTCSVPSTRCDLDHRVAWPRGSTSEENLAPLSRRHHRAKQAGWTPSPLPDGSTSWLAPSGRTYRTPPSAEPPPP